jgi:hypothetical protein
MSRRRADARADRRPAIVRSFDTCGHSASNLGTCVELKLASHQAFAADAHLHLPLALRQAPNFPLHLPRRSACGEVTSAQMRDVWNNSFTVLAVYCLWPMVYCLWAAAASSVIVHALENACGCVCVYHGRESMDHPSVTNQHLTWCASPWIVQGRTLATTTATHQDPAHHTRASPAAAPPDLRCQKRCRRYK